MSILKNKVNKHIDTRIDRAIDKLVDGTLENLDNKK